MKIAVTYQNGNVFQHFGHTEAFEIYDVLDGVIKSKTVIPTNGSGHGALAGLLAQLGVEVLICGGIGGGAQMALKEANIKVFGGVFGDCEQSVKAFLAGNLNYDANVKCSHHGHEHSCGSHSEGHSCGGHNGCKGNH